MKSGLPRGLLEWLGVLGGLVLLLASFLLPSAYVAPFLFFTGLSAGSLALLLIPALTGGDWGQYLRPALTAGARTLPLQALLVLPIVLDVGAIYPWAQAEHLAHDSLLRAQGWYLNSTFFFVRSILYFVLWLGVMWRATATDVATVAPPGTSSGTAAVGLIIFAFTTLFSATDWVMSLMPHWHSTTFGLMVGTGWMLSGAALAIFTTLRRWPIARGFAHPRAEPDGHRQTTFRDNESPPVEADLGNLLLMFVLGWSYLAFMQYLTVWIADLPVETQWYLPRTATSWRGLGWFLIVVGFLVPFAVLLSRSAKRHLALLCMVAILLLVAQFADALWLVLPSLRPRGFTVWWSDVCAWGGMGVVWAIIYRAQLRTVAAPTLTPSLFARSPHTSHSGARHE